MDLSDFRETYAGIATFSFAAFYFLGFIGGFFASPIKNTLSKSKRSFVKKLSNIIQPGQALAYTGILEFGMYLEGKAAVKGVDPATATIIQDQIFMAGLPAVIGASSGLMSGQMAFDHLIYDSIWRKRLRPMIRRAWIAGEIPIPCEFFPEDYIIGNYEKLAKEGNLHLIPITGDLELDRHIMRPYINLAPKRPIGLMIMEHRLRSDKDEYWKQYRTYWEQYNSPNWEGTLDLEDKLITAEA